MKNLLLFFALFTTFTGCAPSVYYQIQTTQSEQAKLASEQLIQENSDYKIVYDFWTEYGDVSFLFWNKTAQNIYLHLDKAFFVKNGMAYDYFQGRVYSEPLSGGGSVATPEPKTVCVPPQSTRKIRAFQINDAVYRSCDLLRYPYGEKQIKSLTFDAQSSPHKFSNRLVYSFDENGTNPQTINHNFWVSEITNIPEHKFKKSEYSKFCNQIEYGEVFLMRSSDKFFIKYLRSGDDKY